MRGGDLQKQFIVIDEFNTGSTAVNQDQTSYAQHHYSALSGTDGLIHTHSGLLSVIMHNFVIDKLSEM